MLLCLLMIGRMLLSDPSGSAPKNPPGAALKDPPKDAPEPPPTAAEGEETMQLVLDETTLQTLIFQALPLRPDALTVTVTAAGGIEATATVSRQTLADSGLISGALRTVLVFLPERCKLYGAWRVAAENGALVLTPTGMEIASIAVPDEAAKAVTELIQAEISRALTAWEFSEITCTDGGITIHTLK